MLRSSTPDGIDSPVYDLPIKNSVSVSENAFVADSFAQIDFEIVGHKLSYSNVESDDILSATFPPTHTGSEVMERNSPSSSSVNEDSETGGLSPNLSVHVGDLSGSILDDLPSTPNENESLASAADAPMNKRHSPINGKAVFNHWDDNSESVCEHPLCPGMNQGPPAEVVFENTFQEIMSLDEDKEEYPLVDPSLYQIFGKDRATLKEQTKMITTAIGLDRPKVCCPHPSVTEPFAQPIISHKIKFVYYIMVAFSIVGCAMLVTLQYQHSTLSSFVTTNETMFYEQETSGGIPTAVSLLLIAPTSARWQEPVAEVVDPTTDDEAKLLSKYIVSENIYAPEIPADPASMNANSKIGVPQMTLNHLASYFAIGAIEGAELFGRSHVGKALYTEIDKVKIEPQAVKRFDELHRFRESARSCFQTVWSWAQRVYWCSVAVVAIFVVSRVLFWVAPMEPLDSAFQREESEGATHGSKSTQSLFQKLERPSSRPIVQGTIKSQVGIKGTFPTKPQSIGVVNSVASTSHSRYGNVIRAEDFSTFLRSCKSQLSYKGRPSRSETMGCREQLGYNIIEYESLTKEDLMHIARHFGLGVITSTANKATLITRVVTAYESMLEGYTIPQLKKVLAVKNIQPAPNTHKKVLVKLAVEAAF